MQQIKFSTDESNGSEQDMKTKGSFFKQSNFNFNQGEGTDKRSSKGFTENSTQYSNNSNYNFNKKQAPQHQINIGGIQSHPNQLIIPKKGVTLITDNGANKKTFYQNQNQNIGRFEPSKSEPGEKIRMSRAQYEQSRSSGLVIASKSKAKQNTIIDNRLRKLHSDVSDTKANIREKFPPIQEEIQRSSSFGDDKSQYQPSDRFPIRKESNNESRESFYPYSKHGGSKSKANKIIVHQQYDVSSLLLVDENHSVLPQRFMKARSEKASSQNSRIVQHQQNRKLIPNIYKGSNREMISRRPKNEGKINVVSSKNFF